MNAIDVKQMLKTLSNLHPGWDSYGAQPPAPSAISAMDALLQQLAGSLILPTAIVASAEGGVAAYFKTDDGERTAYIEIPNDEKQPLFVIYNRNGATSVSELGTDLQKADLACLIHGHLKL